MFIGLKLSFNVAFPSSTVNIAFLSTAPEDIDGSILLVFIIATSSEYIPSLRSSTLSPSLILSLRASKVVVKVLLK